mmetsp:Transcript_20141/g.63067  ORF Transcript_20141/g.63067 Transcript_20141/m.63067 type:complete len:235 (+) Transcript_20141:298-1002(+)
MERDWIWSSQGSAGLCFSQSTRRWVYSGSLILPSRHQMENSPCRRRSSAMRNLKRIRERWSLETSLGSTTTAPAAPEAAPSPSAAGGAAPSLSPGSALRGSPGSAGSAVEAEAEAEAGAEASAGARTRLKSRSRGGSDRKSSQEPKRRRTAGPAGTSRVGAPWSPLGRGTPPRPRGAQSGFTGGSATSSRSKRPRPSWSRRFPASLNSGSTVSCSWSRRASETSSRSQNLDFSR